MAVVRIIVVNFNAGRHLATCVSALAGQSFRDFEVVIADNGSSDGSLSSVADLVDRDGRFRILELDANVGFAAANNKAAVGAATDWLAFVNPDAFAETDWLERLLSAANRRPGYSMLGSTQIDATDPNRLDGTGDGYFAAGFPWRGNYRHRLADMPEDGETFSPCAAAALIRTEDFLAVDGFDERFFCFCEDVDLGFRLRLRGGRCLQVADARVSHVGAVSTGARSDFTLYHSARNRVWTMVKNAPTLVLIPMVPAHIAVTLFISVTALWRGGLAAIWRGVFHAVIGLGPMFRDRRTIQRTRTVSWWVVARAMCWSPRRFRRRDHDVRPL